MSNAYDDWKLQDGGEWLGRGSGRLDTLGACTVCNFRGDATATVKHHTVTRHTVTYRGNLQERQVPPIDPAAIVAFNDDAVRRYLRSEPK